MNRAEVLIVGGGVIGASIAFHLAERGTRVVMLERGRAGGHASLASAGLLHPMYRPDTPAALRALSAASFDAWPGLAARLREVSGIDCELQSCGWLVAATRQDEVPSLRAQVEAAGAEFGLALISGAQARELEPLLAPDVVAALSAPRGAQVYVPALLQAYTHAAARLGAIVRRGVEVSSLCVTGQRVTGALTIDGGEIAADHTVIASGAWSGRLAAQLNVTLPVYPMRGQILALHAIPAPLKHVVFGRDVYLAPKADGSLVVGATYEDAGFDDRLTAEGVGWLLASAQAIVPALAQATFRQAWVGLRPASRDGLPFLGPVPGWQGVTLASGHTAEGVLLSPITGKLIAQHLRGDASDLSFEPFSVDRVATH